MREGHASDNWVGASEEHRERWLAGVMRLLRAPAVASLRGRQVGRLPSASELSWGKRKQGRQLRLGEKL